MIFGNYGAQVCKGFGLVTNWYPRIAAAVIAAGVNTFKPNTFRKASARSSLGYVSSLPYTNLVITSRFFQLPSFDLITFITSSECLMLLLLIRVSCNYTLQLHGQGSNAIKRVLGCIRLQNFCTSDAKSATLVAWLRLRSVSKCFFRDGGYITGVGGLLAAPTVQSYPQGRPFKFLKLYLQVVTIITKLQKRTKCYKIITFSNFIKFLQEYAKHVVCNYRYNRHRWEIGFAFFMFIFFFALLTLAELELLKRTHG